MKKAELLSPCGNFDCVKAAISSGADAVYLGGRLFNARAYASNFGDEELERVCDLCHSYRMKVYVTVNTLYKDEEFEALVPFIDGLYALGVDGLIMQDLGAISLVRKYWPDFPVHASTQLTASCLDDVKAFEAMGLTTAVLSRELNLKEISYIAANTKMRIETFIHGALCVSYSGQCLMSSVLGNRSGNRGRCAQNCRLCYDLLRDSRVMVQGHLLSTKDICTLPLLPKLLDAGAASLKIEGRMKSPEYVAGVTGIYRKYLDMYYRGDDYVIDRQDILTLQQLFNRGAFSKGYLETHSGMEMMCPSHPKHWGVYVGKVLSYDKKKQTAALRLEKDMVPGDGIEIRTGDDEGTGSYLNKASEAGQKVILPITGDIREKQAVYQTFDKRLMDSLKERSEKITRKVPLTASVTLKAGKPASLTVTAGEITVRAEGDIPMEALNQPLTAETAASQIGKLGSTIYEAERISVSLDDGLYLNKSSLNTLKNSAAELLREKTISSQKRSALFPKPEPPAGSSFAENRSLAVEVRTMEQFDCALNSPAVSVIYLCMNETLMKSIRKICVSAHDLKKKIFVKLPRIFRSYVQENLSGYLDSCRSSEIDGFLISSPGHYHFVKDSGKAFSLDFTGNVLNSRSYAFWKSLGAERIGLSPEMSRDEINALPDHSGAEVLAYGHLPLMVTHQCPVGNFIGKKQNRMHCEAYGHAGEYILRSGKDSFLFDTDCRNCICTITTAAPLDIKNDVNNFKINNFRINLSDENYMKTDKILKEYQKYLTNEKSLKFINQNIYDKSIL